MAGEFGGMDLNAAVTDIGTGLGIELSDAGGSNGERDTGDAGLDHPDEPAGQGAGDPGALGEADGNPATEGGEKPPIEGLTEPAPLPGDTPTPGTTTDEAPKTWREEARAKWVALDPAIKAEVAKREEDFFRGIEQYKGDAAVGKDLKQVLNPFMGVMQAHGVNPFQQIQSLMTAHQTLALGTVAQKQELFGQLARDYGIDLTSLAAGPGETPYVDPEVIRLREEQNALKSTVSTVTTQLAQQRQAEIQANIDKFAADPKNVHFAEVANDMALLLKTKVSTTLEDAYQKAIWQNPATRAKEIARQQAETRAAVAKKEADRLAQARKATAVNHRSSGQGRSTTPVGTMDDTLEATLKEINARASH